MIRHLRNSTFRPGVFVWAMLSVLFCAISALAQAQQSVSLPGVLSVSPASQGTAQLAGEQPSGQGPAGSVSGTVSDQTGSAVIGARVILSREDESPIQELMSGNNGEFSFANVPPGAFHLTITAAAFTPQSAAGTLQPGENYTVPPIVLLVAAVVTEVKVTPSRPEIAQYQLEEEEKQRVLGFIPNFYVTYFPNTVPLSARQKMNLVWKATADPVTFMGIGVVAGVEQGLNYYSGYGQGAQGYGKRFGAAYADLAVDTFIGSAALPALLKQDPRYFYKGRGSVPSRFLYAIANSVICKGDNGHWQVNYSKILGDFAAGGISNLYYPPMDRGGFKMTYDNALVSAGITATVNLLNEFVLPKLTPRFPRRASRER